MEFFKLDWGELAKCSLPSLAVILRFNPGDNGEVEFLSRAPPLTIKHVLLQECEEALHSGVVARGSNSTHGPNESMVLENTYEGFGPELTRFNRWKQHLLVAVIVGARRMPPLVSSIQEPFSVWY